MKVKLYTLISDLIERGAERGYRRSFKHLDSPSEAQIVTNIHDAIMNELAEYIDFE